MKPALRSEKEKGQRRKSSMDKVFLILILAGGKTKDPEDDFSQSTRGEAFTTTATRPASTTTATRPASTTTAIPAVSGTLTYQNISQSTQLTSRKDTTDHTKQKTDSNNSHAGEQNTGSDFVLYATVGSVATLSVSLLLATRFRKRRDDVSAEEGEIDSENDDIAKEVRSMMRLSEKNSGAHRPKQDPSTSVYTEVEYSSPPHISETICCSRGVTDSRHSAANVLSTSSEICSICIPPMISKREGDGRLRKHTEAPAALRNALIKATDSCLSTVSVVYYRTCSDSTESKPCSLWFGLDLSE
ncbi:uncharacterized protein LOC128430926 isoform X4 [Pleuronectes platessa]|uniref:uncharacterized protein LOC128430926 isoform X4 n=1 Tax=Pleuronectes platessa TaxID=8262 RepID=UPI00232A1C7C|nr:uncharacterized protein LOC128430926 isoform X4 [Pleuronectes platessa]